MKYKNEFKYLIRLCCSMYICSLVYRFYFLASFHKVRLVSPRYLLKRLSWKILQNSLANTCDGLRCLENCRFRPKIALKNSIACISLWILVKFCLTTKGLKVEYMNCYVWTQYELLWAICQPAITCSMLTIETLEQGVK